MSHWKSVSVASVLAPMILYGCTGALKDARLVFGSGDWNELSLKGDPYAMGKQHFADGRNGLAAKYFQSAMILDPKSIEAINGLAATYDRLGRFDLSELYYRKALRQDPKSVQTLNNLGYSYMLQGKTGLAIVYLEDAKRLMPGLPTIEANRKLAAVSDDLPPAVEKVDVKREEAPQTAEPASTWVERTTAAIQTLITRPSEIFMRTLQGSGVDSRLASHRVAEIDVSPLVPGPGFSPRPTIWTLVTANNLAPLRAPSGVDQRTVETQHIVPTDFAVPEPNGVQVPPVSAPVPAIKTAALTDQGSAAGEIVYSGFAQLLEAYQIAAQSDEAAHSGVPNQTSPIAAVAEEESVPSLFTAAFVITPPRAELAIPARFEGRSDPIVRYASFAQMIDDLDGRVTTNGSRKVPGAGNLAPAHRQATVEISNGTGRRHMAARFRNFLAAHGFPVRWLSNADHYNHENTTVYYREGYHRQAVDLCKLLPGPIILTQIDEQRVDLRVELGGDLLDFDRATLFPKEATNENSA